MKSREDLEEQLNSFDPEQREEALLQLVADHTDSLPEQGRNVNMHYHSFFSYNAEDFSPSRLVWEARKAGLYAAGLCDFDVLDGLEEFLRAGRLLGIRCTANLETRAYVTDLADGDINSPGEPGVTYIMGGAFPGKLKERTEQAKGLAAYRDGARSRNIDLLERINSKLPEIAIDYEKDVLPLTPTGSATERHIVRAYVHKAQASLKDAKHVAEFWAGVLDLTMEETVELLANIPDLEDLVRAKLAKRGGIGYIAPSEDTFPPVEKFLKWVASCDAIPMATWLDGSSPGESDSSAFLECLVSKGAASLNIIPDRNWNFDDKAKSREKLEKLNEIVRVATDMNLPINIGTEMNKRGLPFLDNLDCPTLAPHKDIFVKGAEIMVGHTVLQRYAGFGYLSDPACSEFADTAARNDFFASVGAQPPLTKKDAVKLESMENDQALVWFRDRKEPS